VSLLEQLDEMLKDETMTQEERAEVLRKKEAAKIFLRLPLELRECASFAAFLDGLK
jgi:hypothetical protein